MLQSSSLCLLLHSGRVIRWRSHALLALSFVLLHLSVPAQDWFFKGYGREDGLSHSTIHDIFQDQKGYIWFATDGGGATRFDGHEMTTFGRRDGLCDNVIYGITQDVAGNIWFCGEHNGISRYDGERFENYGPGEGLTDPAMRVLLARRNGEVWASSYSGGVFHYAGNTFHVIEPLSGLKGQGIRSMYEDSKGDVWIGTDIGGIFRYSKGKLETIVGPMEFVGGSVYVMAEAGEGEIWFGTSSGVWRWDGSMMSRPALSHQVNAPVRDMLLLRDGTVWLATYGDGAWRISGQQARQYNEGSGLCGNTLRAMLRDTEGGVWFGTYRSGVCRFVDESIRHFAPGEGICGKIIRAIYQDDSGAMWFGSLLEGICKLEADSFRTWGVRQGLAAPLTLGLDADAEGRLYVATQGGLSIFDGEKFENLRYEDGLPDEFLRCVHVMDDGAIWVGTNSSGIARLRRTSGGWDARTFTIDDGLPSDEIIAMQADAKGNLWIATYGGVSRYDGETFYNITNESGLPDNRINAIVLEAERLWIGAHGGGVTMVPMDKLDDPGSYRSIDGGRGLLDDNVVSMMLATTGELWIGTETGVNVLDVVAFAEEGIVRLRKYDAENGFAGSENVRAAGFADREGNVWFGTSNGAMSFRADARPGERKEPHNHITEVQLFREKTDWREFADSIDLQRQLPVDLVLPFDQNHLTFHYTGICFGEPGHVRYRFRLDGFDEDWSTPTALRHISYANLDPGDYTFQVMASTAEGNWEGTPATFSFRIRPPIWQRVWFIILAILLLGLMAYVFFAIRVRNIRRFNRKLQHEVVERRRTEAKLRVLNKDLDRLLHRATHDLKGPLASMDGLLNIAEKEAEDRSMKSYLEMLRSKNVQLDNILNRLLEVTITKQAELKPEALNVHAIAEEVFKEMQAAYPSVEMAWTNRCPEVLELRTDARMVRTILRKTFSNAFVFRDEKKTTNQLEFIARQEENGCHFVVRDNGRGMPEQAMSEVFEMFTKGSVEHSTGAGLGLYITREAVRRLDGSIELKGIEGQGTDVHIHIP